MKQILILSLALLASAGAKAAYVEIMDIEGVPVIPFYYSHKVSHDGTQSVGEAEDGGTIYYNHATGESYYYDYCSFGRGYVFSDAGWVVGSRLLESDTQSTTAVIMANGKITEPAPFRNYITSDIHSITPDGSRICGVVGNSGRGMSNLPFYCDIDADGNIGEIQFLPTPPKDFFNSSPQYCSATWISEDGKTIAGQVVQSRGILFYPIVYHEDEQGVWSYSFPSQPLFNMDNLPVPDPIGDFEQEYPGVTEPEVTRFMDPDKLPEWNAAMSLWERNNFAEEYDPYSQLPRFMTDEQINAYIEAVDKYNDLFYEYNEKNMQYWDDMFRIADSSVFFLQNGMALSADGNWLAASAQVELPVSDPYAEVSPVAYIPYLFNLNTGEWKKIGIEEENLVTNQVFANGNVLCASPANAILPARSWVYMRDKDEMVSISDYLKSVGSPYYDWLMENLTADVQVSETDYLETTITGLVAASEDFSTLYGGVMGFAIGMDMYVSYIFSGLPEIAGVESIADQPGFNGIYNVFNLQGVKVLTTRNIADVQTLAKGIYIVNGKKVKI